MISAGDFRNGVTLEIEGNIYQILEFQHVKPGKGAAFVRTKLKNIINGGVVEKTFRPTEKFPAARIDRVDMQYLYSDGDLFHFRDSSGLECDAVLHRRNGEYGLIEIKLGGNNNIEKGAETLKHLAEVIDTDKMKAPAFLMVLIGVGQYAYRRPDGVFVAPIGCLKD